MKQQTTYDQPGRPRPRGDRGPTHVTHCWCKVSRSAGGDIIHLTILLPNALELYMAILLKLWHFINIISNLANTMKQDTMQMKEHIFLQTMRYERHCNIWDKSRFYSKEILKAHTVTLCQAPLNCNANLSHSIAHHIQSFIFLYI